MNDIAYYEKILKEKYDSKYTYTFNNPNIINLINTNIEIKCNLHSTIFKLKISEHLNGVECKKCVLHGYDNAYIGKSVGPHNIKLVGKLYRHSNTCVYGVFECRICGKEYSTPFKRISTGETNVCKDCTSHNQIKYNVRKIGDIWRGMYGRCYNKENKSYHIYGGIDITISDEWLMYQNFEDWVLKEINNDVSKLGKGVDKLTLDRKNPYLGYSSSNCRLATPIVQSRNTRYLLNMPNGYMGLDRGLNRTGYKLHITMGNKSKYLGTYATKYEGLVAREAYIKMHDLEHSRFPYVIKPEVLKFRIDVDSVGNYYKTYLNLFVLVVNCYMNKVPIPITYKKLVDDKHLEFFGIHNILKNLKYEFNTKLYYYVCECIKDDILIINKHKKEKTMKQLKGESND